MKTEMYDKQALLNLLTDTLENMPDAQLTIKASEILDCAVIRTDEDFFEVEMV